MTEKEGDREMLDAAMKDSSVYRLDTQPKNITGKMRGYQLEGLNFLINLWSKGMGGILADEMGLGKTLQSISLLGYFKQYHDVDTPHLVAVPLSTLGNWMREINRWCPDLRAVKFHGSKDERKEQVRYLLDNRGEYDVVVTTYEIVNKEKSVLSKIAWYYIVVDEAHRLKNENSLFSKNLRLMKSEFRLLLTGTPLQNNLHELWALLNYLMPSVFDCAEDFDDIFVNCEEDDRKSMMEQLHLVLKPFMIRRLKVDAEKSLLPKKEMLVFVGMSAMQQQVYKSVLDRNLLEVIGEQKKQGKTKLLNIVMQLRKAANHPYLFDGVEDRTLNPFGEHLVKNSGKLVVLDKLLTKLKADGSRVLIFCQMTRMLDIIEDYLRMRQMQYCRIDGGTGQIDREEAMSVFNEPNSSKFVFLLSTRAGGLGINLYTADIVILYDSDWNPQVDLQAQDRAHRIGQKKQVKVFRFVTDRTIEEKVVEAASRKLQMDALVVQSGRLAKKNKLSKDDMIEAIKFGADSIFKSQGGTITDEDIDLILARGEAKTAEMKSKIQKSTGMLKLTLDGKYHQFEETKTNLLEKTKIDSTQMMDLITLQTESLGKRQRKAVTYDENQIFRMQAHIFKSRALIPRPKKAPAMREWQFYNVARITKLSDKAWGFYSKHKDNPNAPRKKGLNEEEEKEFEDLISQGFRRWGRRDYLRFVRLLERHGKNRDKVCSSMPGKTREETEKYYDVFMQNIDTLKTAQRIHRGIEKAEKRISQNRESNEALSARISRAGGIERAVDLMKVTLKPQHREKGFTMAEDRFLVCKTQEIGLGDWDELKEAVFTSDDFMFSSFLRTRTTAALERRVKSLVRTIVQEHKNEKANAIVPGGRSSGTKRKATKPLSAAGAIKKKASPAKAKRESGAGQAGAKPRGGTMDAFVKRSGVEAKVAPAVLAE